MKKSLFVVMAFWGGLAATQAQRASASLDAPPTAMDSPSHEVWMDFGSAGWLLAKSGFGLGTGNWVVSSLAPANWAANAAAPMNDFSVWDAAISGNAFSFMGPLPDEGLWPAPSVLQASDPLAMSPFASEALANGEFKALLSLIDGAPIRVHTANERLRWVRNAYWTTALLLGVIALIYLPGAARPTHDRPLPGGLPSPASRS